MKLERIVLDNFRQYFGRQRIEFARDDQRRVTIIHGVNGAGKTSLFLALNWCLYGRNTENEKVVANVGELMSKEAISHARAGDRLQASVELTFSHDGSRYVARRALRASMQADSSLLFDSGDYFSLMRIRGDGQAEPVSNPIGTINAILPVNVRTYFLFDGEQIDNFAKPEASEKVRDAIYLVLKLEILERARRHLESVAQDYRRELKQVSGSELVKLIERDEKARQEREQAEEQKATRLRDIESIRRKIVDIDQRLRETHNARELQERRERIERELKESRDELDALVNRIRDLATSAYFVIAQPAVDQALAVLDEKRERGEIPSSIRQQLVQDLIAQMRCICGRPFAEHGPEHERLIRLMEHSLPTTLEDDLFNTNAALRSFGERAERQRTDIATTMGRRSDLVDKIKRLEAELDDVSRQLKGSPLEEISRLERQRQGFEADAYSYTAEVGALSERMERLTKEIQQLERDINRARSEEKRERLVSTKLNLAQRSADAIDAVYQTFADEMRLRIEARTREIFKLLVWKESHFDDVQLGPDFNLEVIDRYGRPARPELSAGERQVLSLSFITAMALVSEEEAPLVMDTPFGRLSSQHRDSITRHLPALTPQLILLVTDEELRDQARQNLYNWIGAEYRLEFNPRTSCTEVVEQT